MLGPEYGTIEAGWKSTLTEADRLSDVHVKIKENLCNDIISQIKTWQKDNYHKVINYHFIIIMYLISLVIKRYLIFL